MISRAAPISSHNDEAFFEDFVVFDKLESMSLQIGTISIDDAIQVAEAVNRRLQDLLNADIIRIYWKQDGDEGVIFSPVTFINKTDETDPRPFSLNNDPRGALSWCFYNKAPLWLESIKSTNLENGISNLYDGSKIEAEYLEYFRYGPDSMAVLPLILDGDVRGIFVVELRRSAVFNKRVFDLLRKSCGYIAPILDSAYSTHNRMENKKKAVKNFMDQIRDFAFDKKVLSEIPRTCFIARPFQEGFEIVEKALSEQLARNKIKASCYEPRSENQLVFADIKQQIETAHFCIADVTGNNPNVMAEVGMMMMVPNKKFILMKERDDPAPWPFDIQQYHMYHYHVSGPGNELKVVGGGGAELRPVEEMLSSIVQELEKERDFLAASEWNGE